MTNKGHQFLLLGGVKSILRCDDAEVVRGIAHYVVSQHSALRALSALIRRTHNTPIPAVIALIGWMRSFLSVRSDERCEGVAWIARLSNERRAIEPLIPLLPELRWTEVTFNSFPDVAHLLTWVRKRRRRGLFQAGARAPWRRMFKIARLLHRRYEFFKVLRVVELLAYYARYLEIFQNSHFDLAVMSSHSNPHGIAFNLAARQCQIPTVLISHGMPVRPIAKLSFNLGLIHCEAARRTYREEGCQLGRVLVHGRAQDYAPMAASTLPQQFTVGIFLCKDINQERLATLVAHLLEDSRVSRILIRPHPKNLWVGLNAWIAAQDDARIRHTFRHSVIQDVEATNIVLAGNSSVLIDAVTAGRPSAYVPRLDHGSPDLHEFVSQDLIYAVDHELSFDAEAILRFYRRPDWLSVLRLFANVDEDQTSVARQAVRVMRELAALGRIN